MERDTILPTQVLLQKSGHCDFWYFIVILRLATHSWVVAPSVADGTFLVKNKKRLTQEGFYCINNLVAFIGISPCILGLKLLHTQSQTHPLFFY